MGLGKEGIGAVVGHCNGMRQAFRVIGKKRLVEKRLDAYGSEVLGRLEVLLDVLSCLLTVGD